jgi:hypothetical protein
MADVSTPLATPVGLDPLVTPVSQTPMGAGVSGANDQAVTRSQKRKRDEKDALKERKASGASAETLEKKAKATSNKSAGGKVHTSPPLRPDDKVGFPEICTPSLRYAHR